jgi:hypothetical protein
VLAHPLDHTPGRFVVVRACEALHNLDQVGSLGIAHAVPLRPRQEMQGGVVREFRDARCPRAADRCRALPPLANPNWRLHDLQVSGAAIKNAAGMYSALLSPHRILKSTHTRVVAGCARFLVEQILRSFFCGSLLNDFEM